jgi:hypothetical protein
LSSGLARRVVLAILVSDVAIGSLQEIPSKRALDRLAALVAAEAAAVERMQHIEELLDLVVGSLFHVGLSLDEAARLPTELARERISEALQRLDDTIHEIRDHVFRSWRPGGGTAR